MEGATEISLRLLSLLLPEISLNVPILKKFLWKFSENYSNRSTLHLPAKIMYNPYFDYLKSAGYELL